MSIQVRRLAHALGAEVAGVDISKPLDDKTFKAVNEAFLGHGVLVFRGQPLTAAQHAAFSRHFGELDGNEERSGYAKAPGFPEVFVVVNKITAAGAVAPRVTGADWHSDDSHLPAAAAASLLRCIELPGLGGDTMFCNMYLAYEALSGGMKKLIEGLHGVHMAGSDYAALQSKAKSRDQVYATAHPIVRVHPETGRKALFVNRQVRLIAGMTAEESRPLIDYLTDFGTRPQRVYRHQWQKHDLVIWDNRCLLHMALGDFDRSRIRHMERTTVRGNISGYRYEGPIA